MKIQLLPSTFDEDGRASQRQHLPCFIIDDIMAIDAGSLGMACTIRQRENVRDVVLTHAHLDHIAGLPLFIDDLYSSLKEPVRVHASSEVIEVLERDIFNWSVYPRFSELKNSSSDVLVYRPFQMDQDFKISHLTIRPIAVNHRVPTAGFVISDEESKIAMSGDTSAMEEFWCSVNSSGNISALMIECAFPDELEELAAISFHLTPRTLAAELKKFQNDDCPIFVVNIKPAFRQQVIKQLEDLDLQRLEILEVGRIYDF